MSNELFRLGTYVLHSGIRTGFKIDCDGLSGRELHALVFVARTLTRPYKEVLGVPTGGLALAKELEFFADPNADSILIVDDVLTTGDSMHQFVEELARHRNVNLPVQGLVMFARGECPGWITPIFTLNPRAAEEIQDDESRERNTFTNPFSFWKHAA